jgi:hypothetical protein
MIPTITDGATGLSGIRPVGSEPNDIPILIERKADAILEAAERLNENPLFAEYVASIEEYRRLNNTIPDADE